VCSILQTNIATEYVDQILGYATKKTIEHSDSADLHSAPAQSNLLNLLLAPIRTYVSIFTALALPNYIPLFAAQPYPTRRSVAGEVARGILRNRTLITTSDNLDGVLQILKVLIKEGMQQPVGYSGIQSQRRAGETDETIEEQGWLARIVHFIQGPDNDTQLQVRSPLVTVHQEVDP
jgi:vacuolar protein sorting-associated protein 35